MEGENFLVLYSSACVRHVNMFVYTAEVVDQEERYTRKDRVCLNTVKFQCVIFELQSATGEKLLQPSPPHPHPTPKNPPDHFLYKDFL